MTPVHTPYDLPADKHTVAVYEKALREYIEWKKLTEPFDVPPNNYAPRDTHYERRQPYQTYQPYSPLTYDDIYVHPPRETSAFEEYRKKVSQEEYDLWIKRLRESLSQPTVAIRKDVITTSWDDVRTHIDRKLTSDIEAAASNPAFHLNHHDKP